MNRYMRSLSHRGHRARWLVACVALAGCQEHGLMQNSGDHMARLNIVAAANSAGERVEVALSYARQQAASVPLTTQTFTVTGTGDQQISVSFDLTDCLADPLHVVAGNDGCSVIGTVVLKSAAGDVLDNSSIGPVGVAVGGSADATVTLRAVGTVTITANSTMTLLDTMTAQVVVRDRENAVLTGRTVTWTSSNNAVATVNSSGKITALTVGPVTITATVQGVQGTKLITVQSRPVAQVTVSLSQVSVLPGLTTQANVVTKDASGVPLTGRIITYQTSNASIATVNSSGLVTGVARGTATITAISEGIQGTTPVNVVIVPFALVDANQPSVATYSGSGFNAGGGAITVTRQSQGNYSVQFTGLGAPTLGSRWGVTVSTASTVANGSLSLIAANCNVSSFNFAAPLRVNVRCESVPTFGNVDAPFRLMVFGEADPGLVTGPLYAYSMHTDTIALSPYTPIALTSWAGGATSLIVPDTSSQGLVVEHQQNYNAPINTLTFVTPLAALAGQMMTCNPLYQLYTPTSVSAVVCFSGFEDGSPEKALHFVVKASGPIPGHTGGGAFINGTTGVIQAGQSWTSGTSITSVRTATGKITVTFNGLNGTGTPLGVMVTAQSLGIQVTCTHFVSQVNPVTIDVACSDPFNGFTNQIAALTVLVLK